MEINKIYNKDAFELLFELEDESVDLIILDPNYQDWDKFCADGLIVESVRVLKKTGNILCFTKQPFDFELRNKVSHIFRREIVWTFTNGGAWVSNRMPLVSHQKIYHCVVDSKKSFFNERTGVDYSDNTKDFKRSKKVFEGYEEEGKQFEKSKDGVWLRDHLHFNKPHTGKIPSKPQELYDILIKCYCPVNGTNKNGIPDLLAIPPNSNVIFSEVKTLNGKTSKLQDYRLKELEGYGFKTEVYRGDK
jgi:DNA modification methylase